MKETQAWRSLFFRIPARPAVTLNELILQHEMKERIKWEVKTTTKEDGASSDSTTLSNPEDTDKSSKSKCWGLDKERGRPALSSLPPKWVHFLLGLCLWGKGKGIFPTQGSNKTGLIDTLVGMLFVRSDHDNEMAV
ncbi:hypothetical protein MLD38_023493 [Melastoma candidum]|uniref:Uncharacterized protein n=1 Tax=Melastoma candidum TaxID=119954 RepID=A0ACB9NS17_9MYRT|nr:hypothetical protein MLD38_023493 [Melastoma candidum]